MNRKICIERQSLLVSIFVNFIIGMAGLLVYIVTNLNVLPDGVFSSLPLSLAAYISKNSHRTTESFPNGMYFLEPLWYFKIHCHPVSSGHYPAGNQCLSLCLLCPSRRSSQGHRSRPPLYHRHGDSLLWFGESQQQLQDLKINHMSTMLSHAESR